MVDFQQQHTQDMVDQQSHTSSQNNKNAMI